VQLTKKDEEETKIKPGKVSTEDLIERIYLVCACLMPKIVARNDKGELFEQQGFYPYQRQLAKRIILSVLMNDGDTITALFARQSGKRLA
jgi:hypothetical protein